MEGNSNMLTANLAPSQFEGSEFPCSKSLVTNCLLHTHSVFKYTYRWYFVAVDPF